MKTFDNVPAFFEEHKNDVFCYWVYRRLFTPYEQEKAFMDESCFEDVHANMGFVRECTSLGNGDYLLGFQTTDDSDGGEPKVYPMIEYYKLSEIRLAFHFDEENEEEE